MEAIVWLNTSLELIADFKSRIHEAPTEHWQWDYGRANTLNLLSGATREAAFLDDVSLERRTNSLEESIAMDREALSIIERIHSDLPDGYVSSFEYGLSRSLFRLAEHLRNSERPADALPVYGESLEICERNQSPEVQASVQRGLAKAHSDLGDSGTAVRYAQNAIRLIRSSPDEPASLVRSLLLMGRLHEEGSDFKAALGACEEALQVAEDELGEDAPLTLDAIHQLGQICHELGRNKESLGHARRLFELSEQLHGTYDDETLFAIRELRYMLLVNGDIAATVLQCEESHARHRHVHGGRHAETIAERDWLAMVTIMNRSMIEIENGKEVDPEQIFDETCSRLDIEPASRDSILDGVIENFETLGHPQLAKCYRPLMSRSE